MKIGYVPWKPNHISGSAYKYFTLLKSQFGGVILSGQVDTLADEIRAHDLDLVFVHGDRSDAYKVPLTLGVPYVLIEQDIASLRVALGKYEIANERRMVEKAMAVVLTSDEHYDDLIRKYDLPPTFVVKLRPLVSGGWVRAYSDDRIETGKPSKVDGRALVYAGGIVAPTHKGPYGYKNFDTIFAAFINAGWEVHVYPDLGCQSAARKYQGIEVHEFLPFEELTRELGKYTAGLVGFNTYRVPEQSIRYAHTCMPNKLWDYMAAGIPTIGVNLSAQQAEVLTLGGWGVAVEDLSVETLERLELPVIEKTMFSGNNLGLDRWKFKQIVEAAVANRTTPAERVSSSTV